MCQHLLGCSSFLRIPRNHILFSLASCNIAQSDSTTAAGQPYVLATLLAFAADILRLLQSKASDISSSIKEVNKMIKDNVTTTEAGDFMDFMDGDSEDVLVDT